MPESTAEFLCPTCGYSLHPGEAECPNCGATIDLPVNSNPVGFRVSEKTVEAASARKKAKKRPAAPADSPAPPTPTTSIIEAWLAEARTCELHQDTRGALEIYERALIKVRACCLDEPALQPMEPMLVSLIQQTQKLLEPVAPAPAAVPAENPLPIQEATPPVLPAEQPIEALFSNSAEPLPAATHSQAAPVEKIPPRAASTAPVKPKPVARRARAILAGALLLACLGGGVWIATHLNLLAASLNRSTASVSPTLTSGSESMVALTDTPPNWAVRLDDPMEGNRNGWPEYTAMGNTCGEQTFLVQAGKLIWNINGLQNCIWKNFPAAIPSLTNFEVSVDTQRLVGPNASDFGIVFRNQEGRYYYFCINDNTRKYAVLIRQADGRVKGLIDWSVSGAILPNEVNRLGVTANGSQFTFSVNGATIASLEDYQLASGSVGLGAELFNSGDRVSLSFDNFHLNGNP